MHANTTLHFDIVSGIAGDMALAVLHGLGLDLSEITDIIYKMTGKRLTISVEKVFVNGIETCRLKIDIPHEHAHRKMSDIKDMIEHSGLPEQVITDATGIFSIIAEAEGKVHGKPADEVHFHEVGALDSILDITGFAYGIHKLGIDKVTASLPILGSGFVKCAHGKVPVPSPATLKILEGVEVVRTDEPNELTTPTGAAILKYYVKEFGSGYTGKIVSSSHSTGTLTLKTMPNILRGTLITSANQNAEITVVETNIDDCSGEVIGSLFETLKDKCLDFFCTQTIGKKNRPSLHLHILCENDAVEDIAETLFAFTSTAGVRYHKTKRIIMEREVVETTVEGVVVRVKKLTYKGVAKFSPEWEDCVKASKATGTTPLAVYDKAKSLLI